MSIAEKTLLLKQDFDEVHAKGYEDGKNSVVRLERYSKQIQLTSLNIFGKSEVVLNLDNATKLDAFCLVDNDTNKNTTVEKLIINCPNQITTMQQMLYCNSPSRQDEKLKYITINSDTAKVARFANAFTNLVALEIIDGEPLNFISSIETSLGLFQRCSALIEFRVVANSILKSFVIANSGKLSTETIQSIIDGLADLTGGTAQTLTLHATVGGKLTDEQKATITAKNWELVY